MLIRRGRSRWFRLLRGLWADLGNGSLIKCRGTGAGHIDWLLAAGTQIDSGAEFPVNVSPAWHPYIDLFEAEGSTGLHPRNR